MGEMKFNLAVRKFVQIILLGGLLLGSWSVWATNDQQKSQNNSEKTRAVISDSEKSEKVNINTVSSEVLQNIKYLSKRKAKSIIEYRENYGKFKSLDELLNVKCRGIHEAWLEKVKHFLVVD